MNTTNNCILEKLDLEKTLQTIENCLKPTSTIKYSDESTDNKFISYKKICYYSTIFFFDHFYILKYFNKFFVFEYQDKDYDEITDDLLEMQNLKKYIHEYAIGLILNRKKVSNEDFVNLKKCFMLTENITYTQSGYIYCKYKPYHLLEFTLTGNILNINIHVLKLYCELNLNNIEDDIKSFLNQVFEGIPENDLKMHYTILKYYASLK